MARRVTPIRKITILTDTYHYYIAQNPRGIITENSMLPSLQTNLFKRTVRWKNWFEKEILRQCQKYLSKMNDYDRKIFGSLYYAYLVSMDSCDSRKIGKPKETPILDILERMELEVNKLIEEAKEVKSEKMRNRLHDEFKRIKSMAILWVIKESQKFWRSRKNQNRSYQ